MSRNKNRILVFCGIFLSRISGYIRDFIIARYFGANIFTDAFFNAFTIPNLLRGIFAEGNLSSAFIPNFFDELKKSKEDSIELCKTVFSFLLFSTIIVSIIGMFFSNDIASLMGYGFKDESAKLLSGDYLRIMFPLLIFISIATLCVGVLNSFQKFFITSSAPTILNLGMIVFAVFLRNYFGETEDKKILSLCYGAVFGSIIYFIVLSYPYLRAGYKFSLKLRLNFPPLIKTLKLMLPGIPGQAIYEINFIVNRVIASFLGVGSISYLYYANRLYQFPLALFGIGVSSVLLTSASKAVSESDTDALVNHYYDSFKFMCFFIIPITLISVLTADRLALFVYQRVGEFNYKTAIALQCYLFGLFAYAGANITTQIYYSMKDTLTPVKFSALNMLMNIVLNIMIVFIWKDEDTRFAGLALSNSICGFIYLGILIRALRKKIKTLQLKILINYSLKILLFSAIASIAVFIIKLLLNIDFFHPVINRFFNAVIPIAAGISFYFVLTLIFRVELSLKLWYNFLKFFNRSKKRNF